MDHGPILRVGRRRRISAEDDIARAQEDIIHGYHLSTSLRSPLRHILYKPSHRWSMVDCPGPTGMCYRSLSKTGLLTGRIDDGSLLYLGSIYFQRSTVLRGSWESLSGVTF